MVYKKKNLVEDEIKKSPQWQSQVMDRFAQQSDGKFFPAATTYPSKGKPLPYWPSHQQWPHRPSTPQEPQDSHKPLIPNNNTTIPKDPGATPTIPVPLPTYQRKEYEQSQDVIDAQQNLNDHIGKKPGEYQSQWQSKIDEIIQQYEDRDPFQYDQSKDALYQQAAQQYIRQGKKAMMDSMGQASMMTGGYGNSYAQTAGQQTYGEYLQNISSLAPKYHQMALDRYRAQGEDILKHLGIVSKREDDAYSRYQDQLHMYNSERDRLQNIYDREQDRDYNRFVNDQNFEYGQFKDEQEAQHRKEREEVEEQRYQEQWAHQQQKEARANLLWMLQNGHRPDAKEIAAAGMTESQINDVWNKLHPAPVASSSGGGGGGGYSGGGGGNNGGNVGGGSPSYMSPNKIYNEAKKNGASEWELNGYLTEQVNKGNLSPQDAVALATGKKRR